MTSIQEPIFLIDLDSQQNKALPIQGAHEIIRALQGRGHIAVNIDGGSRYKTAIIRAE